MVCVFKKKKNLCGDVRCEILLGQCWYADNMHLWMTHPDTVQTHLSKCVVWHWFSFFFPSMSTFPFSERKLNKSGLEGVKKGAGRDTLSDVWYRTPPAALRLWTLPPRSLHSAAALNTLKNSWQIHFPTRCSDGLQPLVGTDKGVKKKIDTTFEQTRSQLY